MPRQPVFLAPGGGRGFTLLQLTLAIAVVGVMMACLLDLSAFYQRKAEKARFDYTVGMMRSALRIRIADLIIRGRAQDIKALAKQNPMLWLDTLPANYLGEIDNGKLASLEAGNWYFDRSSSTLLYRVTPARPSVFPVKREYILQVWVAVISPPVTSIAESGTNMMEWVELRMPRPYPAP